MNLSSTRFAHWAALTAGMAAVATTASAQTGLISTNGVIVAYSADPVPDTTGTPIPGRNFNSNGLGNPCAVDESGSVLFHGQFTPTVVGDASDDRAYFYGSNRANLKMVIRGADQAPGMAPGILLRNTSVASGALQTAIRLTPNGRVHFASGLYDGGVLIIGGQNNDAVFGGLPGSLGMIAQKQDQAPGCPVGCIINQAFGGINQLAQGANNSGRIYYSSALSGTGVITTPTNNQACIITGTAGALELVARRGDPLPGIPTAVGNDATSSPFTNGIQMNGAGNILYDCYLSTATGATPATIANNFSIVQYTPGVTPGTGTNAFIVREGDGAPGTFPVATFNAVTGDNWQPVISPSCWTRTNKTIFTAELRGGDVGVLPNGVTNDRAIYMGGVGSLTMVVRKGDAAPGTDAFFGASASTNPWDVDSVMLNDNGKIVFNGSLVGGTSVAANDSGLWAGTPGSLVLFAREGSIEPLTGGTIAAFAITNTQGIHINDQNRILYRMQLTGGTNPGNGLWVYDMASNTSMPILLPGNPVEVTTGVFKNISTTGIPWSELPYNNTDGASLTFMHNGKLGLRVVFSDATQAIMTLDVPYNTPSTSFCLGDGTGAACPCGNTGAAGHGCASSAFATGARLTSTGVAGASAGTDSLVLTATNIPGPGLFFQANGLVTPVNFGDGQLCAAVSIIRLGVVFPTAGVASYPGGTTPAPIHLGGMTANGDTRHYQCWYRSVPSLCTVMDNFDVTQGLTLVWGP